MQNRQWRADIKNVTEAFELFSEAASDKIRCISYYKSLIDLAIIKDERKILSDIHMDEQRHLKMLTNICKSLTGDSPSVTNSEYPIGQAPMLEYQKSILSELEAVEYYRKLYLGFLNIEIRDMLFEIITDEQAHAAKLNFLCLMIR